MKASVKAALDRLEPHFTKTPRAWRDKPPPKWLASLYPILLLKPIEKCSLRLYLREATLTGVITGILFILSQVFIYGALWHRYPPLFTDRRYHRLLIGILSHEGVYWTPWALLGLLAFSHALDFPRFYFWNRRAARLQREPAEASIATVAVASADASVWPPPPTRYDG